MSLAVKYRILAASAVIVGAAWATELPGEAAKWWQHVVELSDDKYEGRKAGTDGYTRAADYVAKQFAAAGLKPAGTNGYKQPVQFLVRQIKEEESELSLLRGGKTERLTLGRDAVLSVRDAPASALEAEAVFAGHGLQIPEMKIDDLRGLDLKGKIVVYLSAAPKTLPGPIAAHAQSAAERWRAYRAAGAIGIASISDPATRDIPWERAVQTRFQPQLALAYPDLYEYSGQQASIAINADHADKFFAGTEHPISEILRLHRRGKPLPKFSLPGRIRVKTAFTSGPAKSDNVIAILRGSDSKLAREHIVLTAHLDHLGVGRAVNGDSIYNGAMDNASGIATLIEVAKALARTRPKRSVMFAAVTAEEGGLMGSKYFAASPTVPADTIVANINFDMFLPIIPLKAITVYGLDESELGADFAAVAKAAGVGVARDPQPERNAFIRSDQYSFIRRGIPAIVFKFHARSGTPEEAVMRAWLKERYHGVKDDIEQPVMREDAARFNRVMVAFVERVASRVDRPQWSEQSFFRRYAREAGD